MKNSRERNKMRKIKAMALVIGIVLVLSMGSAVAAPKYNWNWIGEMLLNLSGEIAEIKETTAETIDIVKDTQDILNEDIYPEIAENRAILDAVIEREETAWNKLVEMDQKADEHYAQLVENQEKLDDADDEVLEELQGQKKEIADMRMDIDEKLSEISSSVQPSLLAIHEDITELRGEIGDSEEVIVLLHELEEEMLNLDSDIVNMREVDDDRYALINGRLDEISDSMGKIDRIDKNTKKIKKSVNSVKKYLKGDITEILKNIDNTTVQTKESVEEVNEKLNAIRDYLHYTVYPEIEENKQRLDEIVAKQEIAWNDIVYVKNKVDENGNEIASNKDAVLNMEKEIVEQLYVNEITIKQMDGSVSELLGELSLSVMARFDEFNVDIIAVKSKLNQIKSDTEGIGASQDEIRESLAELQGDMDKVDLNLDSILRYTSSLFDLLDCENEESVMCDKLDELSESVNSVNANTQELKEGQITIKNYVDGLEEADTEIKDRLEYLGKSFNCESAVPNDVCFRLTLLENYLENLGEDSAAIAEYAETLEDIKLDLEGKIDVVIAKADEAKFETETIKQAVNELLYVTDENFESVNGKLDLLEAEVREITTSGIKLDFDTFLVLEDILALVGDASVKVDNIDNYMSGELKEEIIQVIVEESEDVKEIVQEESEEVKEAVEEAKEEVVEAVEENTEEIIEKINESTEEIVEKVEEESEEVKEAVEEAKEEVVEVVEFEADKTREELMAEIKDSADSVTAALNENSGKLDGILQNWGINDVSNIMEKLEDNMEMIVNLHNVLVVLNETEKVRYEESQGVINSIKEWTGLFDNTAENNFNAVQDSINGLEDKLIETLELNNEILDNVYEFGENDLVYDDIADLIAQNAQILNIVEEMNLTTAEIKDKINAIETSLDDVDAEIDELKQGWNADSEEKILGRLSIIEAKIDYLNVSENTSDLAELVELVREEIGFAGKSVNVYDMMVELESKIVDVESSVKIAVETEGLETREVLEEKITEESLSVLSSINENQIILYELLNKLDEFDAEEIGMIVESNRDKLVELRNWLAEFNETEEMRYEESKKLSEKLLNLIGIRNTTENQRHAETLGKLDDLQENIDGLEALANDILTEAGTSEEDLYDELAAMIDELSAVLGEAGMFTDAGDIRLFKGKNYVTITDEPVNSSIEEVFSDIMNGVKRVEYFDEDGWLIFNPDAPFGNTLTEVHAGKSYWIIMKGDAVLTIN